MVNNCGHNDIGVWAGTNWSEPYALPFDGPRDQIEALDIDDFTHAILRMPSQWPDGSPFSDDHDAVKPDFAVKLCAHHIPGIDYELAQQWYELFSQAIPGFSNDPRTDPEITDGFIALTQTEIPSESLNCLKRQIIDTYPARTWGSGPGTWNSCMELGTTALGRELLKFYRENRGVCHQENLINASVEPVVARVGSNQGQSASAELSLGSGKLGEYAGKAVNQWAAALKADPAWEWSRTLIFLVQTALIVQGHDPGKPDGVMGPETMLALLAWSAVSGPLMREDNTGSYIRGLDDNVAYLLHGTLKAMGLESGPLDQFLGWESNKVLETWGSTFRVAGMLLEISEEWAERVVMNDFGKTKAPNVESTWAQKECQRPPYPEFSPDSGRGHHCLCNDCVANHCLEFTRKASGGRAIFNKCDKEIHVGLCWKGGGGAQCYSDETGTRRRFSLRESVYVEPGKTSRMGNVYAPGLHFACFTEVRAPCGPFAIDETNAICTCW